MSVKSNSPDPGEQIGMGPADIVNPIAGFEAGRYIKQPDEVHEISCAVVVDLDPADCEILVNLYDNTNGEAWTNNDGWLESRRVNNWFGETIEDRTVTEINLSSNQLDGTLPSELGSLTSLEMLTLYDNDIEGEIPAALGNLTNLWYLALFHNDLEGEIPATLGNLTNLSVLALSYNNLSGPIPPELGNIASLQNLALNFNNFQGLLPADIGNLGNLARLDLFANEFLSGPIPQSFIYLTSLEHFWFYDTSLCEPTNIDFQEWKATVPEWLGTVDCSYCYLPILVR